MPKRRSSNASSSLQKKNQEKKQKPTNTDLIVLPLEIFVFLSQFLAIKDAFNLGMTCKLLYSEIWEPLHKNLMRMYTFSRPNLFKLPASFDDPSSWTYCFGSVRQLEQAVIKQYDNVKKVRIDLTHPDVPKSQCLPNNIDNSINQKNVDFDQIVASLFKLFPAINELRVNILNNFLAASFLVALFKNERHANMSKLYISGTSRAETVIFFHHLDGCKTNLYLNELCLSFSKELIINTQVLSELISLYCVDFNVIYPESESDIISIFGMDTFHETRNYKYRFPNLTFLLMDHVNYGVSAIGLFDAASYVWINVCQFGLIPWDNLSARTLSTCVYQEITCSSYLFFQATGDMSKSISSVVYRQMVLPGFDRTQISLETIPASIKLLQTFFNTEYKKMRFVLTSLDLSNRTIQAIFPSYGRNEPIDTTRIIKEKIQFRNFTYTHI